jgi:hypothetical protein
MAVILVELPGPILKALFGKQGILFVRALFEPSKIPTDRVGLPNYNQTDSLALT